MKYLLVLLFVWVSTCGKAQFIYFNKLDKSLVSKVQIRTEENVRMKEVAVSIRDTLGVEIQKVHVRWNGQFTLEVPYDQVWDLWVSCDEHQTKIIRYNTLDIPECEGKFGFWFGDMTVNLQKNNAHSEANYVASIFYDPEIQNFDYQR